MKNQNQKPEWNKNQDTKGNNETLSHKVGDKIEAVGDALTEKGFKKVGEVIHKAGDKIEHMQDKRPASDAR